MCFNLALGGFLDITGGLVDLVVGGIELKSWQEDPFAFRVIVIECKAKDAKKI